MIKIKLKIQTQINSKLLVQANIQTVTSIRSIFMAEINFKTFVEGIGTDLKTSIDDVISAMLKLHEDLEALKTSKTDKN